MLTAKVCYMNQHIVDTFAVTQTVTGGVTTGSIAYPMLGQGW